MTIQRILFINGGKMDRGGISSYMMNYYRQFDHSKFQVDFLVHGGEGEFDNEIRQLGGRVLYLPSKKQNWLYYHLKLMKYLKTGNYKLVHSHADGMNGNFLFLAYLCKIPIRISHSHNTDYLTKNPIRLHFQELSRRRIPKFATQLWACSEEAGRWLYGKSKRFQVIPNAIDIYKNIFSPQKREELRERYNLKNNFVIGHIGRFDYQKNHYFLVNIFKEVVYSRKNAILVLVGSGHLESEIKSQVEALELEDKVLFLGQRDDVSEIINIFDVFAFPSLFEGLGISVIEAQTNGLHCICSTNVPAEVNITGQVEFIDLEKPTIWKEQLLVSPDRISDSVEKVYDAGYSIIEAGNKLQNLYLKLMES